MRYEKIKEVKNPTRGTKKSAGIDFYVPDYYGEIEIGPQKSINIESGIRVEVPKGFALIAFNKSGVALKKGLQVGACVVDEDYQGEIHLHLINISSKPTKISGGEKLIQFILVKIGYHDVQEVKKGKLYKVKSERGEGGFGSTGTK